jgi:hypothetical protein
MIGHPYSATRYCSRFNREVTVWLEILPAAVRVSCGNCSEVYVLPRFGPRG